MQLVQVAVCLCLAAAEAAAKFCELPELEGIRRDCFYDFEAELASTPPKSFHVLMQKCNDSMLSSYPIMSDCVSSRLELHNCDNKDVVLRRLKAVKVAHRHLCSAKHNGQYCRTLPKNLPHYVNLCIVSLLDGMRRAVVCSSEEATQKRSTMAMQKSQDCVSYIQSLMGSPCYYLKFNFFNICQGVQKQMLNKCRGGGASQVTSSSMTSPILAAVALAVTAAL